MCGWWLLIPADVFTLRWILWPTKLPSHNLHDRQSDSFLSSLEIGFFEWNFFQSRLLFFFSRWRSNRCNVHFIATCTHVLHNRIVVRVLQRYRSITSLFIRRVPHCGEMYCRFTHTHTQRAALALPLYFYFYFVCRTSRIPGELIISVFNFLPLDCTELCVLNAKLLNALPASLV